MTDIIERAEAALENVTVCEFESVVADLLAALRAARAEADVIEQQILPALGHAVVAAEIHRDFKPHMEAQKQLQAVAKHLRGEQQ